MLSNAFCATTTWICLEFAAEDPERESTMLSKAEAMLSMNKAVYEDELLLTGVKGICAFCLLVSMYYLHYIHQWQ